jgi:hypothetical protein
MKIDPNESATGFHRPDLRSCPGLTIRAHFAATAMQGLLHGDAGVPVPKPFKNYHEFVASLAVMYADALIAELNK